MTSPTQALASTLARDWILEVNTGTSAAPAWTRVRGLSSVAPIFEGALQDDSDIDSEGYASQIATGLAHRVEGGGKRKGENTSGFADDPGQNFLRQKGRKVGYDNIIEARVYRRDELPDAYQSEYAVQWTDTAASDVNALQEFSFTLQGRGKPQEISKPTSETVWDVAVTGSPTDGTFTLSVGGQTTTGIAYDATSSAVQSALEALSTVGAGNATVTGSAGSYNVTLASGGTLTADGSSLTGGTTPDVTVTAANP
ncbi:phage tail tube protein [Rhodococcus sp. Chr-9]|uniref:phage tail tube protein n=1 Tax=Rhodococcus sp. Chr-9 TaxID=713612 RepID=UPI000573833E|nr:hypothetical protein [Rhodococcus sp. Chr-9]KHJ74657.1 hypothetical protein QR64_00250 [Rhodococcus sp. Chr-9]